MMHWHCISVDFLLNVLYYMHITVLLLLFPSHFPFSCFILHYYKVLYLGTSNFKKGQKSFYHH